MVECVTCQLKYFTDDSNTDCVTTGDLKCLDPGLKKFLSPEIVLSEDGCFMLFFRERKFSILCGG